MSLCTRCISFTDRLNLEFKYHFFCFFSLSSCYGLWFRCCLHAMFSSILLFLSLPFYIYIFINFLQNTNDPIVYRLAMQWGVPKRQITTNCMDKWLMLRCSTVWAYWTHEWIYVWTNERTNEETNQLRYMCKRIWISSAIWIPKSSWYDVSSHSKTYTHTHTHPLLIRLQKQRLRFTRCRWV